MDNREVFKALSEALKDIVKTAEAGTVCIYVEENSWRTGVWIDERHILTVALQAEEGERLRFLTPGGTEISAAVSGFDAGSELTLLSVESPASGEPAASQGKPLHVREDLPAVGELSVTVAFPSPEGTEARLGMIRCVADGKTGGERYIQTDSPPFPGFAGSALLDTDGRLLGITAMAEAPASAYIIPASDALSTAKRLIEGGSTKYAYLGIRTVPVELPPEVQKSATTGRGEGLLIVRVEEGSPAANAGLLLGDILVSLDGNELSDYRDLIRLLSAGPGGKQVEVEVIRAGERKKLNITPGSREASISRRYSGGSCRGRGHGWHGRHHRR